MQIALTGNMKIKAIALVTLLFAQVSVSFAGSRTDHYSKRHYPRTAEQKTENAKKYPAQKFNAPAKPIVTQKGAVTSKKGMTRAEASQKNVPLRFGNWNPK